MDKAVHPEARPDPGSYQTYRRLLGYSRPYAKRLYWGLFFAILSGGAVPGVLLSLKKNLGHFFGIDVLPESSGLWMAILLPGFMILQGIGSYFSVYFINWVGTRVVTDLRSQAFAHLQELSLAYFTDKKAGDLISRVSNDTTQVQGAVSSVVGDMIREPFVLIGALGVVFYELYKLNALSVSYSLLFLPLCIVPVLILGHKIRRYSKQNQERLAGLVSILQENVSGVRIVKSFGMEHYEQEKFEKENQRVFSRLMRIVAAKAIIQPLMQVVSAVSVVIALVYARDINMPITDFFTILGALIFTYQPIRKLGRVQLVIQQSSASADRIFELIDAPVDVKDRPDARELEGDIQTISFEQVSFAYDTDPVLRDISLDVPAGKCIALVGSSGSGKTSLVGLLPRFFDVTRGTVRINGKDVRSYTLASLRRKIAVVSQETFLFNDTVGNNITYGMSDVSRDAIEAAARRAHAHEFIMELPHGYDTEIGDRGVRLSGGQRQRLSLARALFRDAPILILDEATSALDSESERLVQQAIDALMQGRTVFAIAHRLSTIQHADQILVLDAGRIIERGTHQELLDQGGQYKYLYDLQF